MAIGKRNKIKNGSKEKEEISYESKSRNKSSADRSILKQISKEKTVIPVKEKTSKEKTVRLEKEKTKSVYKNAPSSNKSTIKPPDEKSKSVYKSTTQKDKSVFIKLEKEPSKSNLANQKNSRKKEKEQEEQSCNQKSKHGVSENGTRKSRKKVSKGSENNNVNSNLFARKVKRFVSKPISEESVSKLYKKIITKSKNMNKNAVRLGEDLFPSLFKPNAAQGVFIISDNEVTCENLEEDHNEQEPSPGSFMGNTMEMNPISRGKPFWIRCKLTDKELEGVAQDRQMNADTIVAVSDGTLKLKTMPTLPVAIEPFGELTTLQSRDKSFFHREVIFGNTLRSMINCTDGQTISILRNATKSGPTVKIKEPKIVYLYQRKHYRIRREEPFVSRANEKIE